MAAVSKVESGVVELRTDVGRLYVCPSTWQRAYLRWTFRNFHTLPQQVLNRRQQRLIEALSRTAIVTGGESIPAGAIIGVVEGVRVLALPSSVEMEAAKPAKPAHAEAKLKVVQGSRDAEEGARLQTAARGPTESEPVPLVRIVEDRPSLQPEEISASADNRSSSEKHTRRREWWAVPALGAAAFAVLVLAFQLAPLWRVPQIEASRPAPAPPSFAYAKVKMPAVTPSRAPVAHPQLPAASHETQLGARKGSAKGPEVNAAATAAASPVTDSIKLPQIAEAPQSGFIYPVAPNPNLVGKVLLKAVIGSDGTVKQVEVLSGDRALAAAAARAVRHWHYAPAQVDGRAVDAQTHVMISFLGDDAVSISLPPAR